MKHRRHNRCLPGRLERPSLLLDPYRFGGGGGGGGFQVDAAQFTTSTTLRRTSNFSGVAASKTGILSFFYHITPGGTFNGVFASGFDNNVSGFTIYRSQDFQTQALSSGGATVLNLSTSSHDSMPPGSDDTSWHHYIASWNLASGTPMQVYVDDTDFFDAGNSVSSNTNIPWNQITHWGLNAFVHFTTGVVFDSTSDCAFAEFYLALGQSIDLSVTANRRKWVTAALKPVNLGATGSTPTGSAPTCYNHLDDGEAPANFATNRAGNGDWTVNGTALSTFSSSPSD